MPSAFVDPFELLQEVGELFDEKLIDSLNLGHLLGVVLVMREFVMPLFDVQFGVGAVAAGVGEHERGDAGRVGLKREGHQVVHQPDVLGRLVRDAGRDLIGRDRRGDRPVSIPVDPLFDLADALEILVHLATVGRT